MGRLGWGYCSGHQLCRLRYSAAVRWHRLGESNCMTRPANLPLNATIVAAMSQSELEAWLEVPLPRAELYPWIAPPFGFRGLRAKRWLPL